jgi:hypothetical protein
MNLLIEQDHPMEPALRRWASELPDGVHIELVYGEMAAPHNMRLGAVGKVEGDVRQCVQSFLDIVAGGRRAFIRCMPTVQKQHDFEHDVTLYHGYVRFAVLNVAGDWVLPKPPDEERYLLGSISVRGFGTGGEP